MRIAILAAGYPPAYRGGGPIRTVHALARSIGGRHDVFVLTSNRDLRQRDRLDVPRDMWVRHRHAQVYYASVDRVHSYWTALRELKRRQPDVVYVNSYFNPKFSVLPRLLHRMGWWGAAPLILAPRGEFSPGALQFKSVKKWMFMRVASLIRLDAKTVWHASSEHEADDIRRTVPTARTVLVRPNETDLPQRADGPLDVGRRTPRLVFVSRLVPIKGLDVALRALAAVTEPVHLDVYGSEEDATYVAACRALARQLPAHVTVRFHGPLQPDTVRSTIGAYDAFVLPTHGENFGHVIAEALSTSCPVLTSTSTPWTEVLRTGGGRAVSPATVASWTAALDDYARRIRADSRGLRAAAGAAYESWRAQQEGPTIFDLHAALSSHTSADNR